MDKFTLEIKHEFYNGTLILFFEDKEHLIDFIKKAIKDSGTQELKLKGD